MTFETLFQRMQERAKQKRIPNLKPAVVHRPIKTHCKYGHPRTPENLTKGGACYACVQKYQREYQRQTRARRKG